MAHSGFGKGGGERPGVWGRSPQQLEANGVWGVTNFCGFHIKKHSLKRTFLSKKSMRIGRAKVNKVKNFSEPHLHVETCTDVRFRCSGVCFVDFIRQNKAKILHKVKTCQNCLQQNFPYKNEKTYISFIFF